MKDVLDQLDGAFDLADRFFGIDSRAHARTTKTTAVCAPARPAVSSVKQIAGPVGQVSHVGPAIPAAKTVEAIDETGAAIWIVKRGDHEMICNSRPLAMRAARMLDGAL